MRTFFDFDHDIFQFCRPLESLSRGAWRSHAVLGELDISFVQKLNRAPRLEGNYARKGLITARRGRSYEKDPLAGRSWFPFGTIVCAFRCRGKIHCTMDDPCCRSLYCNDLSSNRGKCSGRNRRSQQHKTVVLKPASTPPGVSSLC